jgi:hypothetical protein
MTEATAAAMQFTRRLPSPHRAVRCLKILLRQTVAQEDQNATRKFGTGESQSLLSGSFAGPRRICMELVSNGKV